MTKRAQACRCLQASGAALCPGLGEQLDVQAGPHPSLETLVMGLSFPGMQNEEAT